MASFTPKYESPYTGLQTLQITAAEDERLGNLKLKWLQETRDLLNAYMTQYKNVFKSTTQKNATLKTIAPRLFDAYIHLLFALELKGEAVATAIIEKTREPNVQSQYVGFYEEPAFFGLTSRLREFNIKDLTAREQQNINVAVQDFPLIAEEYGLSPGSSNLGPATNEEVYKKRILAGPDSSDFILKKKSTIYSGLSAQNFFSGKYNKNGSGSGSGSKEKTEGGARRKNRKNNRKNTRKNTRKNRKNNRKNTRR